MLITVFRHPAFGSVFGMIQVVVSFLSRPVSTVTGTMRCHHFRFRILGKLYLHVARAYIGGSAPDAVRAAIVRARDDLSTQKET